VLLDANLYRHDEHSSVATPLLLLSPCNPVVRSPTGELSSMSALAQQNKLFSVSPRRLSEPELLRAISKITWNAGSKDEGVSAVATALLRVTGLTGFRFESTDDQVYPRAAASAVSAVSANGHTWGQIRIFFDPHATPAVESPVRLAKFVGQQIGILLHRLSLQRERDERLGRLAALDRIMRRRKVIHRAVGILAEQRSVSSAEATSLMAAYARRNRRPLLSIAESLIFGFDSLAFTRPSLRRLTSTELTSESFQRSLA
jgi:ANTAR domain